MEHFHFRTRRTFERIHLFRKRLRRVNRYHQDTLFYNLCVFSLLVRELRTWKTPYSIPGAG